MDAPENDKTVHHQTVRLGIADALKCSAGQASDQRPLSLIWGSEAWHAIQEQFGCSHGGVAIALDAYMEKTHLDRPISYSRDRSHYSSIPKRYRCKYYQYRTVVGEVDRLAECGLINHDQAFPGRWGWRSSFRATKTLVARVHDTLHGGSIEPRQPREPIILRDSNGDLVDYRDSDQKRRIRRQVQGFNEAIMASTVRDIYGYDRRAMLLRIYNRSFQRGGRLYAVGGANWQNFKTKDKTTGQKFYRADYIRVDGEPVVEVDFKTLHPMLLYASAGKAPPDDPYDFGWPTEYRDLIKRSLLVMINAGSTNAARCAIAGDNDEMPWFATPGSSEAFVLAKQIMEKARHVHKPIKEYFNSDAGIWLMNKDARIAVHVMRRMLKHNTLVLPVHDSFLAPARKVRQLEEAMVEAAEKIGLKRAKLERKGRSRERWVSEEQRTSSPAPCFASSPCPERTFYRDLRGQRGVSRDLDEDITAEAALRERGQMRLDEY